MVKCAKCGFVGQQSEFRMGVDFFQKSFVAGCPKCGNHQSPGDASMRMFGGERPIDKDERPDCQCGNAADRVMHASEEAS